MKSIGFREGMLLLALSVALGGWLYKNSQRNAFEKLETDTRRAIAQIRETRALKQYWNSKGLTEKLKRIKQTVPAESFKRFEMKRSSVEILAEGLEGRTLNRFLGKLGALPLQVQRLDIERDGKKYRLECRCIW